MAITTCDPLSSADVGIAEPVTGNYFVAVYPPFSTWRSDQTAAVRQRLDREASPGSGQPFGLYVHVPFCVHRCAYCYYLSYADKTRVQMEQYLDALIQELALYREMPAFAGRRVGFVYFGGGTPSLLPVGSLWRLLHALQDLFPWADAEEVTFECAPRSVTPGKLLALSTAGVNRLSLGVQQLDDEVLRQNGRVHRVADVARAWELIREVGFEEVNVDLIAGLMGETEISFRDSLERVIDMRPDSVTVYPLEVPHNTPLYRTLDRGEVLGALPTWETKRARLGYAFARLERAGYTLRSAYAAARSPAHRRFVYQEDQYRGADLLGIGVASFSYVGGVHYQNLDSFEPYVASVSAGRLPLGRACVLSDEERLVREFVLQLKLGRVGADYFRDKFGVEIGERFAGPLADFAARGWLTYDSRAVALTRAGLLRVDRLLPAFFLPEHQRRRYS